MKSWNLCGLEGGLLPTRTCVGLQHDHNKTLWSLRDGAYFSASEVIRISVVLPKEGANVVLWDAH